MDLDIIDYDALARKADALFQSHKSSFVNSLSDDIPTAVHDLQPPPAEPAYSTFSIANSFMAYSSTSGGSSTPSAPSRNQWSLSPV